MFRSLVAIVLLTLLPAAVRAQTDVHRVVAGETLWEIAGQQYGAPSRWTEIFEANKDVLEDPHRIFPGQQLKIPFASSSGPTAAATAADPGAVTLTAPSPTIVVVVGGETLWAIAGQQYGSSSRWPEIFAANRDVVEDPDWIFPGEQLRIPGLPAPPSPTTVSAAPPPDTPPADSATPVVASIAPVAPAAVDPVAPAAVDPVAPAAVASVAPPAVAPVTPVKETAQTGAIHDVAPAHTQVRREGEKPAPGGLRVSSPAGSGVRTGDQIEVFMVSAAGKQISAVEGPRLVDDDGNLTYAFIGNVHVEGLDAPAIQALLAEKFSAYYSEPVVEANVKLRVNVTGLVGAPGHYLLDPTATVLDALSTAGGIGMELTYGDDAAADPSAVRLIRNGETTRLDLRPGSVDAAVLNMTVQSGDWLHVPARVQSHRRDDIQFWGGLLSVLTSAVTMVVLATGH